MLLLRRNLFVVLIVLSVLRCSLTEPSENHTIIGGMAFSVSYLGNNEHSSTFAKVYGWVWNGIKVVRFVNKYRPAWGAQHDDLMARQADILR